MSGLELYSEVILPSQPHLLVAVVAAIMLEEEDLGQHHAWIQYRQGQAWEGSQGRVVG